MFTRCTVFLACGCLCVGLLTGAWLARGPVDRLTANADRWGERAVATGPVSIEQNAQKFPIAREAIYYLNYNQGLLLATVPVPRNFGSQTQVLNDFAERDLVKDFELPAGSRPHFLMTVGALGGATGEGWSPLYVFETESGQVAVYRVEATFSGGSTRPVFRLLEKRRDPRLGRDAQVAER